MSDTSRHEALIQALGEQLTPVRRLLSPWRRTLGWMLLVAVMASLLLWRFGAEPMMRRWEHTPDLAIAAIGALLTAISAAWAAFSLGVPGRSRAWIWLPVPPALLWIGASGVGCLRVLLSGDAHAHTAVDCLFLIIGFSIPLSVLMIVLLRRACPLSPVRTAVLIGLASAGASAVLLEICHSFISTGTDLALHALAVFIVIAVNAAMGGRLLQPRQNLRS
ncbi:MULTISPECIES: NrsF family protein [Dyella]|uniref:DUF1109 domain-containing protein n=2 Tax=Dyella TaxID=231454 RepID=A0A4R0Z2E0_9GAMM|nr:MULTISPECIES: NrsF family protein [Dyella]TBR39979.1 DUF1109 domain-containing protein [Dyella terrae]TCI12440.1 DUF1109 domain-containing protein [Dyella soli]